MWLALAPHCTPNNHRQHEIEADALACRLMGQAGVPPQMWASRLQLLQHVAAEERQQAHGTEAVTGGGTSEEEEEAEAYLAAAALLAARVAEHLAADERGAAQALLDASLRWPVPASWLRGMGQGQAAELLLRLMHTHPPLRRRVRAVQQLALHQMGETTYEIKQV